ncbi:tetratricopeptide repeat protein [Marinifilum flexuosum]|uniref:tetratricopeptide repeat protein n=1 Tax=Marinifilum flexuosum TaxID=1117708 RepID=UPI002492C0E4|nr:tetratricopeptide repeat protein [Marinifilum flexuosum]
MKSFLLTILLLILFISHSNADHSIKINELDSLETKLIGSSGREKLEVLMDLCECLVEKDSKKCILYSRQALDLARKLKQPNLEIKALIYLGREHSNLGNYFEGLQNFKKAQKIAIENKLDHSLVDAWNEIGITYFHIGNYKEAQTYYFKALEKAELIKYKEREIGLQNNIAIIYSIYKDHDKALELFTKLLNIYEVENDSIQIALTSVNISNIYDELGKYEEGLEYLNKAIPIFISSGNKLKLSSTLNNRGNIYSKVGQLDKALTDYWDALKIAEKNNFESGIISSSINLGQYYVLNKKHEKAIDFFENALKISLENHDKARVMECYEGLANAYELSGNYKMALSNTRLYLSYKDEIYNEQTQKQISEIQIKYETEKKENEIEFLQDRIKTQKRNLLIILGGLLVISVLILRVLKLKQSNLERKNLLLEQEKQMDQLALQKMEAETREKEQENLRLNEEMVANEEINRLKQLKYKTELKHKERELAANALHMVSKNETLNSFKKLAEDALLAQNTEVKKALRKLIQEIESNIHLDQDWDKFKMHFEEVHQGFFKSLLDRHTDLNTNELRFCAYLRLNLDAKEIARILNISVNAIEKRRYRLRKKLSLESTDSLFEYINRF